MSMLENARQVLLRERNEAGHWTGQLSSSALSTATALIALSFVDRKRHGELISGGAAWLRDHQNDDGGWGDAAVERMSNFLSSSSGNSEARQRD